MISVVTHMDLLWPTSDDWHPNFARSTVRVRLTSHAGFVRLSVWGADDTGVELDISVTSETETEAAVETLTALSRRFPSPLTKGWLAAHGFVAA